MPSNNTGYRVWVDKRNEARESRIETSPMSFNVNAVLTRETIEVLDANGNAGFLSFEQLIPNIEGLKREILNHIREGYSMEDRRLSNKLPWFLKNLEIECIEAVSKRGHSALSMGVSLELPCTGYGNVEPTKHVNHHEGRYSVIDVSERVKNFHNGHQVQAIVGKDRGAILASPNFQVTKNIHFDGLEEDYHHDPEQRARRDDNDRRGFYHVHDCIGKGGNGKLRSFPDGPPRHMEDENDESGVYHRIHLSPRSYPTSWYHGEIDDEVLGRRGARINNSNYARVAYEFSKHLGRHKPGCFKDSGLFISLGPDTKDDVDHVAFVLKFELGFIASNPENFYPDEEYTHARALKCLEDSMSS